MVHSLPAFDFNDSISFNVSKNNVGDREGNLESFGGESERNQGEGVAVAERAYSYRRGILENSLEISGRTEIKEYEPMERVQRTKVHTSGAARGQESRSRSMKGG
mmetsp:Transcript_116383/g.238090  ORF Transcript_116383/g.238090 Transcript_116383/m.238090 type:complete len:105 (-) Transcript_116383:63-377(-)